MQTNTTKIIFQSNLPTKCLKDTPKEEVSINSKWLIRGGFVNRLMGGVYSYLPLGLRVLQKIENIVREEMNAMGSSEVLLPALHPKANWDKTERWDKMTDIIYSIESRGKTFGLGATHEEVVTPLMANFINSYKDLPMSVYQIQTKYRNEARPKSGVLRGREFRMKDMYSFHISQEDLDAYYDKSIIAYNNIFKRCGIGDKTYLTYASGGVFSKYSHEFQAITEHGEDTIYLDTEKNIAINEEVIDEVTDELKIDKANLKTVKAIEVGNIFKLSTRFPDAFGLTAVGSDGKSNQISMGCYGIGTSRVMGAIVELCHDENGIIWPVEVSPYDVHIIVIGDDLEVAKTVAASFEADGKTVLLDDRKTSAGQKFAESDIIGIPYRVICSPKLQERKMVELKSRATGEVTECAQDEIVSVYNSEVNN